MSVPNSSPKRIPWGWILGIGCGLPILGFAGCSIYVASIAKKVVSDPEFKKTMEKAQKGIEEVGKNMAAEKTELVA
jgi:hypothetical protein